MATRPAATWRAVLAACCVAGGTHAAPAITRARTPISGPSVVNRWHNPEYIAHPVAVAATSCPPGHTKLTAAECESMAVDTGNTFGRAESWSYYVPGCFNHGDTYYFNTHPVGAAANSNNNAGKLWCQQSAVSVAATACPAGHAKLSEAECKTLAADSGNAYGRAEAWPQYVPGCFNHGDTYYFNTHPTGRVQPANQRAGDLWCRRARTPAAESRPSTATWPATMFPNGEVVYAFASPSDYVFPEFKTGSRLWGKDTAAVKDVVFAAMRDIEAKTSLRFRARTADEVATHGRQGTAIMMIGNFHPDYCSAHGISSGRAMVYLGANHNAWCGTQRGVVEQEMLHALQMGHEFQRIDRDSYVTMTNPTAGGYGIDKVDTTLGLPMDFASVMQYPFGTGGLRPTDVGRARLVEQGLAEADVGRATELSVLDAEKLNRMYFAPEATAGRYSLFGFIHVTVAQLNPGSGTPILEMQSPWGSWALTPLSNTAANLLAGGRQTFAVGATCPWFASGYTTADVSFGAGGAVAALAGPHGLTFARA